MLPCSRRRRGRRSRRRNAAGQAEHPLAFFDAQPPQYVGEAVALLLQCRIADIHHLAGLAQPAQRDPVPQAVGDMPVDGFMGDVQAAAAGQAVEVPADFVPGEVGAEL